LERSFLREYKNFIYDDISKRAYSYKAIMEVHPEQGCGYGSVLVKTSLNNLMYNQLCSWTARAIESNP
jgi:hypothetical protein